MDRDELRRLLRSSYVLFSCEGTAEAVCIQKLVDAKALVVPRANIVDDPIFFTPYTRLRKADVIAGRFLRTTFEGEGLSGLTICRIVDSRSGKFRLPRQFENDFALCDNSGDSLERNSAWCHLGGLSRAEKGHFGPDNRHQEG